MGNAVTQWRAAVTVSMDTPFQSDSEEELETLVVELAAGKNRYFHRGGYTPFTVGLG